MVTKTPENLDVSVSPNNGNYLPNNTTTHARSPVSFKQPLTLMLLKSHSKRKRSVLQQRQTLSIISSLKAQIMIVP